MVFFVRILYDKGRSVQSVLYAALYLQFQPAQKEDYPMMKSVSAWKQELSSGAHAARLASLYCCAPEETAPQAARYEAALNGLETTEDKARGVLRALVLEGSTDVFNRIDTLKPVAA